MENVNTTEKVLLFFSKKHNLTKEDILSANRTNAVCMVRYMIFTYLHLNLKISSYALAKIFNRHRINVLRGIRCFKHELKYNKDIRSKFYSLIDEYEQSL